MDIDKTRKYLENDFVKMLNRFVDISEEDIVFILEHLEDCLIHISRDFRQNEIKYFELNSEIFINLYNSLHLFKLFYWYSHKAYLAEKVQLSDKFYLINKIVNACDVYGAVKLPDIYSLDHPVGTVLGRATYGNYFTFQQGCTIGGDRGLKYPVLGENVRLYANSSVIGSCILGDNVFIASNSHIKNENIPANSLVFGTSPNLIIVQKDKEYFLNKSVFNLI